MGSYLVSLPERVLRSASALAGGLLRELGDVALPAALRRTRLYRSLVDVTLRFLIEQVGQVEGAYPGEAKLADDFLLRRTAGNGLELIGILTFRASPVWVLAALADLSGAGRQLIQEIAGSLKQQGLLDPETNFETMDQLLDGLEKSSARLADTINTPPLDVGSLRAEWDAVRAEAARIPRPNLPTIEPLRQRWADLQRVAEAQGRSVFELSALVALSAIKSLPANVAWLSQASRLAARRTRELFAETLLDHYDETLREIREKGFTAYWREEFRPYLKAAANQFSPKRDTATERWMRGRTR